MSFLDDPRSAAKVGIAVVLLFGALIGLAGMGGGYLDLGPRTPSDAELEAALKDDPTFSSTYAFMEQEFPEDYRALKAAMLASIENGGGRLGTFAAGRAFMQGFMAAHVTEYRQAPASDLMRARDLHKQVIEQLAAESPALCAHFAMTGIRPGDQPSRRAMVRMAQALKAQLQAVAAGRDDPVERAEPTEADGRRFADALASQGMTDAEIDDFFQGSRNLRFAPEDKQCEVGLAIYRALTMLPTESSARLSAVILLPTN